MKLKNFLTLAIALCVFAPASHLFADVAFHVTESYSGLSGEDGTEDWIEVTNFGTMTGDTSTLFYEDSSADPALAQQLPSFMLAPGESAVVLVGVAPGDAVTAADDFSLIWGMVDNVGVIDGGGLGGGGDSIVLFDGTGPMANTIDSVSYTGDLVNVLVATEGDGTEVYATVQYTIGGGAFASSVSSGLSNTFFNDNLGSANDTIRLAGSVGSAAIPEPTAAMVLSIGLCALARRRR